MVIETLSVGPLQCNCSILGDPATGDALVVDPGGEVQRILATVARLGLTVRRIVVTHAHIDHIAGAARLRAATGAPVSYHPLDLPLARAMDVQAGWLGIPTPEVAPPDDPLAEGPISAGSLTGTVLHTPGHTEGSVSLHFPAHNLLLSGDTLFAGSVGRTDLPGGDFAKLMASLRGCLLALPDDTRVIPGHGPATTIGTERESNPFLQDA